MARPFAEYHERTDPMFGHLPLPGQAFLPSWDLGRITEIVAFGDSLSDTGNYLAGERLKPCYSAGRFSNGLLWLEHLAALLGVPAPTPSRTGGTNYAWATTTRTGHAAPNVPNLLTQIGDYLSRHTPHPGVLVTVWSGGNDFLTGKYNPAAPVKNLGEGITTLARAGCRHFLLPNLPLLGLLPAARHLNYLKRSAANALTRVYNALLKRKLRALARRLGVTIHHLDVCRLFREAHARPTAFGFTNVTEAALRSGTAGGHQYLFFDHIHPSSATHQQIGEQAFALMCSPQAPGRQARSRPTLACAA
jgi:phospholipase/lecithinase/hemolysin